MKRFSLFLFLLIVGIGSVMASYNKVCLYKGGYFIKMDKNWYQYTPDDSSMKVYEEYNSDKDFYYVKGNGVQMAIPSYAGNKDVVWKSQGGDWVKAYDVIRCYTDSPGRSPQIFAYDTGFFLKIDNQVKRYDPSIKSKDKFITYEVYKVNDAFYFIKNKNEALVIPRQWWNPFQKYDYKKEEWVKWKDSLALYDPESPKADSGKHYEKPTTTLASNNTAEKKDTQTKSAWASSQSSSSSSHSSHSHNAQGNSNSVKMNSSGRRYTDLGFVISGTDNSGNPQEVEYHRCVLCDSKRQCYRCNGTKSCTLCNGTGVFGSGMARVRCVTCNGTRKCNTCYGTGICQKCKSSPYPGYTLASTVTKYPNGDTLIRAGEFMTRLDANGNVIFKSGPNGYSGGNTSTSTYSGPQEKVEYYTCSSCGGSGLTYDAWCLYRYDSCHDIHCNQCGKNHCTHARHSNCSFCDGTGKRKRHIYE